MLKLGFHKGFWFLKVDLLMDEAINAWFPPTSTSVPFSFEVGVFFPKKLGADERKIRFS